MILLDADTLDNLNVINARYQRLDQRTGEQIEDIRFSYVVAYLGERAAPGDAWEAPFTDDAGFTINGVYLNVVQSAKPITIVMGRETILIADQP